MMVGTPDYLAADTAGVVLGAVAGEAHADHSGGGKRQTYRRIQQGSVWRAVGREPVDRREIGGQRAEPQHPKHA